MDLYDAHNLNNLGKNFHMQLECYQVCMRSHRRAVVRLLEVSQGIFTLVSFSWSIAAPGLSL